jgi:hypothetical protein
MRNNNNVSLQADHAVALKKYIGTTSNSEYMKHCNDLSSFHERIVLSVRKGDLNQIDPGQASVPSEVYGYVKILEDLIFNRIFPLVSLDEKKVPTHFIWNLPFYNDGKFHFLDLMSYWKSVTHSDLMRQTYWTELYDNMETIAKNPEYNYNDLYSTLVEDFNIFYTMYNELLTTGKVKTVPNFVQKLLVGRSPKYIDDSLFLVRVYETKKYTYALSMHRTKHAVVRYKTIDLKTFERSAIENRDICFSEFSWCGTNFEINSHSNIGETIQISNLPKNVYSAFSETLQMFGDLYDGQVPTEYTPNSHWYNKYKKSQP